MRQAFKITSIIIIAFGLFYFLQKVYFNNICDWLCNLIHLRIVSYFLAYIIVGLPLIIGLFLIHKPKDIISSIGINKDFSKGLLFAFLFTLPMLIGYIIFYKWNSKITFNDIFIGAIFAAFFEELYFRGILFGQLFRYAKIGFIPSILLCALLFASGHLWQSSDVSVLFGIFATTFLGAIFFAWTYIEWDNNLWIPMGLHLFMNLHWNLFSAGDNALGGLYANIFRVITITLTIVGTILYKKRNGLKLSINRNNLWINKTHMKPTVDNI
jgi:membrane protease YdiL (CAAX protease family)